MPTVPPNDAIRYDLLVQDALRGVMRRALDDAARRGLPGEHHFYITFRTHAPGVQLSDRMRKQYPEDMTIVLQHQFWDLVAGEREFQVGLSFRNIPEKLIVPYEAVTKFEDPAAQFALAFNVEVIEAEEIDDDETAAGPGPGGDQARAAPAAKARRAPRLADATDTPAPGPAPTRATKEAAKADAAQAAHDGGAKDAGAPDDGAQDSKIVSIDAFRKKT